jgi:uncharacterized repeat protein (TIGR03843 family)
MPSAGTAGAVPDTEAGLLAIHKPIAHERPLWDYPHGTLAERELAAYLVSAAGGFGVVPPTVLREGPFGPGSLQQWVGPPGREQVWPVVAVTSPESVPDGWLPVLQGVDEKEQPVIVSHSGDPSVRTTAVFDAVIANSDRKGGHLVGVPDGIRGFDHGVSLATDGRLRTVLWGWLGQPLTAGDRSRVETLAAQLLPGTALDAELHTLLTAGEVSALRERVAGLFESGTHPQPAADWPAVPWPPM